jgi:hypothetical protein
MVLWGDVYCNDSPYLISKVCIPEGTSICGFGRGNFRFGGEQTAAQDHEIHYLIKSADQIVIMDGRAHYLGDLLEAQRLKAPDKPGLQYYEATLEKVEQKWELKKAGHAM